MSKLYTLHEAAQLPQVRRLGLSKNHLKDAVLRGALKQEALDMKARNGRTVYAVSDTALADFLEDEPTPESIKENARANQPKMIRSQTGFSAARAKRSPEQHRKNLITLRCALLKEAREFELTLEQYLEMIDYDPARRAELANLMLTDCPSQDIDDDRRELDFADGEEGFTQSLLCLEESSDDDADELPLGNLPRMAE